MQISRTPDAGQSVNVNYTIFGGTAVSGTNYTLSAGTIPLPNTTVVNISPSIIADADAINQTLIITLSSPTNANLAANTVHTLTIREATVTSSTPTYATANGIPTPASVATNNPVIGWKFTLSITNDSQTAYQVVFATSEANLTASTYSCDSVKISSSKSVNTYSNLCTTNTLTAWTSYWKVRTYKSSDTASATPLHKRSRSAASLRSNHMLRSIARSISFTLGWTDNASNETDMKSTVTDDLLRHVDSQQQHLMTDHDHRGKCGLIRRHRTLPKQFLLLPHSSDQQLGHQPTSRAQSSLPLP